MPAGRRACTSTTSKPDTQEPIGDFPGMTFAPRFSPDGTRLVLSRTEGGATNLFTLDLRSRRLARLTSGNAIDTSPSYSPDGNRIVFNSDRGGSQQLYVMSAERRRGAADQLRFGEIRHAGMVAARRPDRVHQDRRRIVLHRRDAAGRFRRAAVDAGLSRRGADLGAERTRADVFPPGPHRLARRRRQSRSFIRSTLPGRTSGSSPRRAARPTRRGRHCFVRWARPASCALRWQHPLEAKQRWPCGSRQLGVILPRLAACLEGGFHVSSPDGLRGGLADARRLQQPA